MTLNPITSTNVRCYMAAICMNFKDMDKWRIYIEIPTESELQELGLELATTTLYKIPINTPVAHDIETTAGCEIVEENVPLFKYFVGVYRYIVSCLSTPGKISKSDRFGRVHNGRLDNQHCLIHTGTSCSETGDRIGGYSISKSGVVYNYGFRLTPMPIEVEKGHYYPDNDGSEGTHNNSIKWLNSNGVYFEQVATTDDGSYKIGYDATPIYSSADTIRDSQKNGSRGWKTMAG